jgi:PAS domain S-box-containing protein
MYREGLRLLNAANGKTVYQNNLAHLYSNIFFGLLALFIVTFAVIIIRSITYPLKRLHEGTEIIAGGNLDYKTNIRTPDEIGQLSNAFDFMTENLQKITVSRDELSQEIEMRKQAERKLRESAEWLATTLRSIGDGVIATDTRSCITFMNPVSEALTGWRGEEALGRLVGEVFNIVNGETGERAEDPVARVLREGTVVGLANSTVLIGKDGTKRAIDDSGAPIKDDTGKIIGTILVFHDITERKRAEEALRQSEEKYRIVLENIEEGYYEVDIAGNFTFLNDSMYRIFGYPKEELMGMNNRQYTDQKNAKRLFQAYNKVYRTGIPDRGYDYEIIRKDGTKRYVEVSISLQKDSSGKTIGFKGIMRDITERKQAEEVLRTEKQRFETLSENAPFGMVMIDQDGIFKYINPKFRELFGYDLDDVPNGKTWFKKAFPDPKYRHEVISTWVKDLESIKPGEKRSRIFTVTCKDGTEKIINFIPVQLRTGENLMTYEDITERKRAEEALLFTRFSLDHAIDTMVCVGHDGRFIDVNDAFCRSSGYSREELLSMTVHDIDPDYSAEIWPEFWKKLKQAGSLTFETCHRSKEGRIFPVEITANFFEYNGKEYHCSFARDITEHKRAEEERRNLETKLQRAQKMEALGLMAGGVAHDLNNMLSAIVSLPELILMDIPEEDQKLRRRMQMIMSSGEKISTIVDDLLTITRGVTMAQDTLNLNKIVQEYMRSPEFEKLRQFHPKVEVVTELVDDLLPIRGSRVHLMKTLMNLVSNASEAIRTSDSGVVSVSTQNRYVDAPLEGYERVNIGEYAVLVVKDNGMGISPQDMERIFEPFYTKKVMGRSGTGLGLSVVWNTVTDHGGYIHVESGDGGTVFELYFPITRESVSEQEKPLDLEQYKGRGEKVLVVDDEPDQRVIAVDILSKLGYQAEAVSGGQEALEFLKEHEVDILLLDMLMPGMDGCDTFSQIMQLKPGQKAVIASGFSLSDRVKKAQELGAGAYIRKPYSIEKLGMAIKTELDK